METNQTHEPWNKGKLVGQKPPLKPKEIWAIRIYLQNEHQLRDLAMFNLAIDSKLRGCDLVNLRVRDVMHADQILPRAMVVQRKTQRPVQFELTEPSRSAVAAWIETANLKAENYLFPSRLAKSPHISTRQYARIVDLWVTAVFSAARQTPSAGNSLHAAHPWCGVSPDRRPLACCRSPD
jgi:integrase